MRLVFTSKSGGGYFHIAQFFKKIVRVGAFFVTLAGWSQGVTIGSPNPPDPASVLDIQSVQGGVLFPRMTALQRDAIANAPDGLMIYNTDTECLQIHFTGQGWQNIVCRCQSFPSAVFTGPAGGAGPMNTAISFQAPVGSGVTYIWSFEQGTPGVSSQSNPSVTWAAIGKYGVTLTATDANGCSSTYTDSIQINNCPVAGSQVFSYTGSVQTFTVPACKTQVFVEAWGAQGGNATNGGTGGLGGYVSGTLAVTPGQVLQIYVGGTNGYNGGGQPGLNGNSTSGVVAPGSGGVGGGASDVRVGSGLNDRVIVAGGGGGGGHVGVWNSCQPGGTGGAGGVGGGTAGGDGSSTACNCTGGGGKGGQAGTQAAGGAGGTYNGLGCGSSSITLNTGGAGAFGQGGNGSSQFDNRNGAGSGGGGGGGWYGGGAGANGNNTTAGGGGGGGSNYVGGVTGGISQNGVRSGNGQVIISWN